MSGIYRRIYQLNDAFFDAWSPQMAYVLGFWFADGYMRKEKSYRILFTSIDKDILLIIREALSSSHQIITSIDKRSGRPIHCFCVYSQHLFTQLQHLGGTRKKSKNLIFPSVPSRYLPDFIRGYFDGDGSVFYVNYIRTKDKKIAHELRTNFTSGSRDFLEDLMRILYDEIALPMKKIGVYDQQRTFKLGYGQKASQALLRYMYYANFPIGLHRKAKFLNATSPRRS